MHSDKLGIATHIPSFHTYAQAQSVKDCLFAEDGDGSDSKSCVQTALASGRRLRWRVEGDCAGEWKETALASGRDGYRSTWNLWATSNTNDVLRPIQGA